MLVIGKNLCVNVSGRTIFEAVNVRIEPGTSMAIVGASGSGKTTLLNCLGLLVRPTHGDVMVDNRVMSSAPRSEVLRFWRDSAAFVYQDSGVIDDASVGYNVSLSKKAEKNNAKAIESVLEKVGLGGRIKERAVTLSGGEKQRLGIARAMYKDADIIFADEPTASLDSNNRSMVRNLLLEQSKKGACIVISTHDIDFACACDAITNLST